MVVVRCHPKATPEHADLPSMRFVFDEGLAPQQEAWMLQYVPESTQNALNRTKLYSDLNECVQSVEV